MVDRSELYPGAVVTARVRIIELNGDKVAFCVAIGREAGAYIRVATTDIISVEPRPLAVGDRVRKTPDGPACKIALIVGDEACLVWDDVAVGARNGRIVTTGPYHLSDLTRIPDPAPAEKAMRFKVGDRVISRINGEGRVLDADPDLEFPYLALFDGLGSVRFHEADLSPAPAEDAP